MRTSKPDTRKRVRGPQTGMRLDPELVKDMKIAAVREGVFFRQAMESAMRLWLRTPKGER